MSMVVRDSIDHILAIPGTVLEGAMHMTDEAVNMAEKVTYTALAVVTFGLLPRVNRMADKNYGFENLLVTPFSTLGKIVNPKYAARESAINRYAEMQGSPIDDNFNKFRKALIGKLMYRGEEQNGIYERQVAPRIAVFTLAIASLVAAVCSVAYGTLCAFGAMCTGFTKNKLNAKVICILSGTKYIGEVFDYLRYVFNHNPARPSYKDGEVAEFQEEFQRRDQYNFEFGGNQYGGTMGGYTLRHPAQPSTGVVGDDWGDEDLEFLEGTPPLGGDGGLDLGGSDGAYYIS